MPEPSTSGEIFGMRIWALVAGFAGAVVSLSFVQGLSPRQAAVTVGSGWLASAYLTPLGVQYLSLPQSVENGSAFIVGLCGMSILGGLFKAARNFRDNPLSLLRRGGR